MYTSCTLSALPHETCHSYATKPCSALRTANCASSQVVMQTMSLFNAAQPKQASETTPVLAVRGSLSTGFYLQHASVSDAQTGKAACFTGADLLAWELRGAAVLCRM
mmetsp:Transcript_326/g.525  ORF Transcript_326/g.525 Transcript_326/m.525 type:complete len:107 (-) Transcript_326:286-606(-)